MRLVRVSIFLLIVLLSLSCQKKDPIKIGFTAALSGRKSELGIRSRNCAIMAINEINEKGGINGRSIKLVIKNNQDNPANISKIFTEFKKENIKVVIGPLLSKMAAETIKYAEMYDILVISPTISTDRIRDLDDNFIRLISSASVQGTVIGNKIIKDGYKRAAVVYDYSNLAYTEPVYLEYKKVLKKNNIKLVYENDMKDRKKRIFDIIAEGIKKTNTEAVFFVTSSIDAAEISQQLRKINSKAKLYGSFWTKTVDILKHGGRSVEGMVFVTNFKSTSKSKKYLNIKDKFYRDYKQKVDFIVVYTYEAVSVLEYALNNVDDINAKKIKSVIIKRQKYKGLEEDFIINKFGDTIRTQSLEIIKDGNFKALR